MHLDCYVYTCFVQAHSYCMFDYCSYNIMLGVVHAVVLFPSCSMQVALGTLVDWLIDSITLACENNIQFFTVCNTYNVKLIHYDTTCAYIPYIGMAHAEGIGELYALIDDVQSILEIPYTASLHNHMPEMSPIILPQPRSRQDWRQWPALGPHRKWGQAVVLTLYFYILTISLNIQMCAVFDTLNITINH